MISVLMSTYHAEQADRLARALESIFTQTLLPEQVVLVVDGPVLADQESVIARYRSDPRIANVTVARCQANVGLANALNTGLAHCQGDWIMRMDSDDISLPNRAYDQMHYLQRHPEVDLLAGWSEEFFDDAPTLRIKSAPEDHSAIIEALKWRNVLVHPSVMVRAATLRMVGGYRDTFHLLEDWDLYIRLAQAGAKFAVVPKVMIRMLVGRDQASRRGGLRYLATETRFRTFCWSSGFLSLRQYLASTGAYMIFRLLGPGLRTRLYRLVRTPAGDSYAG